MVFIKMNVSDGVAFTHTDICIWVRAGFTDINWFYQYLTLSQLISIDTVSYTHLDVYKRQAIYDRTADYSNFFRIIDIQFRRSNR